MKLTYFQVAPHLAKKTLAPVYIISGDEPLLKQDVIQAIREAAIKAGFLLRIVMTEEKMQNEHHLYQTLFTSSLFTEKQMIECDFRKINSQAIQSILKDYANRPHPNLLLLVYADKIDDKKNEWYSPLEKIGISIALKSIPPDQLPQWLSNRAKKHLFTFHHDALMLLSTYVEGNLIAGAQMIEKIALLKPNQMVDCALVQSILSDESQFTIFDFVDHLMRGQPARALHILNHLERENIEPSLILWGITRELRLVAELVEQLKQGVSYDQLFQQHRIFYRRQATMRHALKTFSRENCLHFLKDASHIDQLIKNNLINEVWQYLQLFCLKLQTHKIE